MAVLANAADRDMIGLVVSPTLLRSPAVTTPPPGQTAAAGAPTSVITDTPPRYGEPVPARPFNMNEWRASWGAWWGPANREVIRAAILKAGKI